MRSLLQIAQATRDLASEIEPRSDISKARFEASLAQTRNTEMTVLMERGDVENVQMVADRLENTWRGRRRWPSTSLVRRTPPRHDF